MYIDVEQGALKSYEEFKSTGTIFAFYDKQTMGCTGIVKVDVLEGISVDDYINKVFTPTIPEGQGCIKVNEFISSTIISSENYVDLSTNNLLRKPKFKLSFAADPDYDPVKQTIKVRTEPYMVNIEFIDYNDKPIEVSSPSTLKIKDRENLLTLEYATLPFPDNRSFRVKASFPGNRAVIRVKDDLYKYVPGLLSVEILAPSF